MIFNLHYLLGCSAALLAPLTSTLTAGCYAECCNTHRTAAADAIVTAKVTSITVKETSPNRRKTTATLDITTTEKGSTPPTITISYPGGELQGIKHIDSRHIDLTKDATYRFHLKARKKNKEKGAQWKIYQTAAEKILTPEDKPTSREQSAASNGPNGSTITNTGYFEFQGNPGRFSIQDSGRSINVRVDTQTLPSGITQQQALDATRSALDAWENASSLKFNIIENTNFGNSASAESGDFTTLNIQLHDLYNQIGSSQTLGIGGGSITTAGPSTVNNTSFISLTNRYVILNHRSSSIANELAFREVLTHEIGHAIGLVHSSENPNETNQIRKNATMYYRANFDGRGADIRTYDQDCITFGYPLINPPSTAPVRFMRVVTRRNGIPNSPANTIYLESFSVAGAPLTYTFPNGLSSGGAGTFTYSSANQSLTFTPAGLFNQTASGGSFFVSQIYQVSDGVNSAQGEIRIIALVADQNSTNTNASHFQNPLPKTWLDDNFSPPNGFNPNTDPYLATSDPDNDGITNLQEFQRGSDPNQSNGNLTKPTLALEDNLGSLNLSNLKTDDFIRIESSDDLLSWNLETLFISESPTDLLYLPEASSGKKFYRVRFSN